MYAIVDIETTGGFSGTHRITEIAVLISDGKDVTEEYHTLVNPGRSIPGFITGLTGISYDMVQNAPPFAKIASELYALLADKVFVAHNVNFDYNFIKEEFRKLGMVFNRPRLCTVRLSRQVFPGLSSYSLGNICAHRGIDITDRHRAFGDAEATARLFSQIMLEDAGGRVAKALQRNSGESFLPPHISMLKYLSLPEAPGVYYFHDARGRVIYVGKAQNIRSRFKGHFSAGSKDKTSMKTEIYDVSFELTGSDFLALLLEALEIKRLWPKYNRAQKVQTYRWGIYQYEDSAGYQRLQIAKSRSTYPPVCSFATYAEASSFLLSKLREHRLCFKLCGIHKSTGACYAVPEGHCDGACCGMESAETYNAKVADSLRSMMRQASKLLIREKGRESGEDAAIYFNQGLLIAYGFIDQGMDLTHPDEVISCLKQVKPVPETTFILKSYLSRSKLSLLEFP